MKIVIIGGVAAGTKAAAKISRENPEAELLIVTKGKHISYAGCGLPYYLSGVIEKPEDLIVNTPESFEGLTGARVLVETEVTKVLPDEKVVLAKDAQGEELRIDYDKLVIATGADSVKPPIPGIDLEGVYYLRTPEDTYELHDALKQGNIKRALVVGGGFIGLEAAENIDKLGIRTVVIDMAPQILPGFDPEMAAFIENHLAERGIMVFTGTMLKEIEGEERVTRAVTDGRSMKVDAVVMSVGIRPNTAFLRDTDLEFAPNGTLVVNENLETNLPDIYACGDCATTKNAYTGKAAWSPMGSSANMEGRVLAQRIAGKEKSFKGSLGTAVVHLPGLNCGKTGFSMETAKAEGYDPVSVTAVVDDKAHYYPGAGLFYIKMIADRKTEKFLGVQVLGEGAVDKIVDLGVMALNFKASLSDLEDLDLAYAPPFSTAIHPFVHMVNVLKNKMEGRLRSVTPSEYLEGKAEGYRKIDAHIEPAGLAGIDYVDYTTFADKAPTLDPEEKLLILCSKGKRAYLTQNRLEGMGFKNTLVLEGGSLFNNIKEEN